MAKTILLFYHPLMKPLAEKIAAGSEGKVTLGEISWSRFPDGTPNLRVHHASKLRMHHVAFLGSMHDPAIIFEQLAVIYALPRQLARTLKVIIPYFPTGTMERVTQFGDVATAATLSRILSAIPAGSRGRTQIAVLDIHTLQNQFYFSDNVLIRLASCSGLLRARLAQYEGGDEDIAIAFPDDGAEKRFGSHFAKYPHIVCSKVRDGDKRIVTVKDGDPKGKHVVIVDDLIQSGGTMVECATVLHQRGAKKVSGFVTHAIFPKDSHKKLIHDDKTGKRGAGNFSHFWVTDSLPTTKLLEGHAPFEVLSVHNVLLSIIRDDHIIDSKL